GEWQLRLRAQTEEALDGSNVIGVAAAASDGPDALDQAKPPSPPGSWVQLALRIPPEDSVPELYCADLPAVEDPGHAWEIELRSSKSGEAVALEALPEGPLPESLKLSLIDRELGNAVDLRRTDGSLASYRLLSAGPRRAYHLTLLAGSVAYISQ